MELNRNLDLSVDDGLENLPQDLKRAYTPGVHIYFWDKYQDIPAHICCEDNVFPHVLNQRH